MEQPSASNTIEDCPINVNNRRSRYASSDYTTEVSLFNSKSDSWALNLNDETTQTGTVDSSSVHFDQACTDAERQRQQPLSYDEENVDLLLISKQRLVSNHNSSSPSIKPGSSNLISSNENPWKKLSSVRYKLDEQTPNNKHESDQNRLIHEQHITYV